MPRIVSGQGVLPPQLDFVVPARGIDSAQTLRVFNSNNSTDVSANAPQTIVIRMNSSKWLNTNSSYFQFDATITHTTSAKDAVVRNGVGKFFKSLTVLNNGTVIEQIRDYAIIDDIINISQIEAGSDNNWDMGYEAQANRLTQSGSGTSATREYTLQPTSGFLSSEMMLPLFAMGEVEIRLELNTAAEAIVNITDATALTGADFSINNFKYVAELHDMPVSFNRMTQDVINATGLSIPLSTFDTVPFTSTTASSQQISIPNNSKSVKSTFAVQRLGANVDNTALGYDYILDNLTKHQLKVGGNFYPLIACNVGAQSWKEYVKSVQREGKAGHRFDISSAQYNGTVTPGDATDDGNRFIMGFDRELFCGTALICGEDWSESDITYELTYSSSPTADNRWVLFIYKDITLTVVPQFNIVVNS